MRKLLWLAILPLTVLLCVAGTNYVNYLSISGITASRAAIIGADQTITNSSVTATELAQLSGVTIVPSTRTITIAGTANQVISSAGAQDLSANRTWTLSLPQDIAIGSSPTFSGLTLTSRLAEQLFTTTTDIAVGNTNINIIVNGSSSNAVILPNASGGNQRVFVKNITTNVVNIICTNASDRIDARTNFLLLTKNQAVTLQSNGTNDWYVMENMGFTDFAWNYGPAVYSNSTSELTMIPTNTMKGRTLMIQPSEFVAGLTIRIHCRGFTTQTTGQNIRYRTYLGGFGGTVICDNGASVAGINVTTGTFEFDVFITFTSATQCRGYMNSHFPTLADKPINSTTLTTYATPTTSVPQQIACSIQSNSTSTVFEITDCIVQVLLPPQ